MHERRGRKAKDHLPDAPNARSQPNLLSVVLRILSNSKNSCPYEDRVLVHRYPSQAG